MSILAALATACERIPDAPPFGFSLGKIAFVISLNEDGAVADVIDVRSGEGKKRAPRAMQVPQPSKRTVGIAPSFLWDKTSYVLGVTGEDLDALDERKRKDRIARIAREHAAFREYHLTALLNTNDVGLLALRRFLESWQPEQFVGPLWPDEIKDQNVVFALEAERRQGAYLHDRPAAKSLWTGLIAAAQTSDAVCLVTGSPAPISRLHPAIKGVWGAQSSGASIVSFNLDAFTSYGHEQGENAPISEAVAFKYTTALNTFLASTTNRVQIGDASTVFWAEAPDVTTARVAESTFSAMFAEVNEAIEAAKIGDILVRIRNGQPLEQFAPDLADERVRFFILGLSPNAARLSIRFWFESSFGVLARNYRRFVQEMRIEPPPRGGHPALWRYLAETAVLGKRENVPPNLAGEWMRAILAGTPFPLTLLSTTLMRIRADKNVNALRAGMLKAMLVRNFDIKEAPVSLDRTNINKGYLLGRLFATYEQTQSAALGRNVNATIKDKFYGAASAQPRKVFPLLDRSSVNHLSKVGKQRPGQRINLEKTISAILGQMSPTDDPFPASLTAQDQALFTLGYYHQRNEFFRRPETSGTEESAS